jgi:hypothetical protein
MDLLAHWLATSPRYSTDPNDARVLPTEDEAEQHREQGWRVDGPYVEATAYQGHAAVERAVDALMEDSGLPRFGPYRATIERRVRLALTAAGGQ